VSWVGSALDDLRACPEDVRDIVGYALYLAQQGGRHPAAKRLCGALGGLTEVVATHASGTYRAVYSTRADAVCVLHVFQKKSTHGVAMPRREVEVIKARLRWIARHGQRKHEGPR
jgi:phage-related protein